jgi:hypothetical protein
MEKTEYLGVQCIARKFQEVAILYLFGLHFHVGNARTEYPE